MTATKKTSTWELRVSPQMNWISTARASPEESSQSGTLGQYEDKNTIEQYAQPQRWTGSFGEIRTKQFWQTVVRRPRYDEKPTEQPVRTSRSAIARLRRKMSNQLSSPFPGPWLIIFNGTINVFIWTQQWKSYWYVKNASKWGSVSGSGCGIHVCDRSTFEVLRFR